VTNINTGLSSRWTTLAANQPPPVPNAGAGASSSSTTPRTNRRSGGPSAGRGRGLESATARELEVAENDVQEAQERLETAKNQYGAQAANVPALIANVEQKTSTKAVRERAHQNALSSKSRLEESIDSYNLFLNNPGQISEYSSASQERRNLAQETANTGLRAALRALDSVQRVCSNAAGRVAEAELALSTAKSSLDSAKSAKKKIDDAENHLTRCKGTLSTFRRRAGSSASGSASHS
jgi:chromosome segregation ATPase